MTYEDLKTKLNSLTEEQLQQDVTVVCLSQNEVTPAIGFVTEWPVAMEENYDSDYYAQGIDSADGVLDRDHPFLTVAF